MSFRQDRLTFFGVLAAVVIAVLGYLQLGTLYPVQGRAQAPQTRGDEVEKQEVEKKEQTSSSESRPVQEETAP